VKKANVRVLEVPLSHDVQAHDYKRVGGGLLVHDRRKSVRRDELKVVTKETTHRVRSGAIFSSPGALRNS